MTAPTSYSASAAMRRVCPVPTFDSYQPGRSWRPANPRDAATFPSAVKPSGALLRLSSALQGNQDSPVDGLVLANNEIEPGIGTRGHRGADLSSASASQPITVPGFFGHQLEGSGAEIEVIDVVAAADRPGSSR